MSASNRIQSPADVTVAEASVREAGPAATGHARALSFSTRELTILAYWVGAGAVMTLASVLGPVALLLLAPLAWDAARLVRTGHSPALLLVEAARFEREPAPATSTGLPRDAVGWFIVARDSIRSAPADIEAMARAWVTDHVDERRRLPMAFATAFAVSGTLAATVSPAFAALLPALAADAALWRAFGLSVVADIVGAAPAEEPREVGTAPSLRIVTTSAAPATGHFTTVDLDRAA